MSDDNEMTSENQQDPSDLINGLQDRIDELEAKAEELTQREAELRVALEQARSSGATTTDSELQALARTVRTARRNGHPDANKHLEKLLDLLGG